MGDEAANITERILPNAPVRQWLLSLPFKLRGLTATKPDVLTAFGGLGEATTGWTRLARFEAPGRAKAG